MCPEAAVVLQRFPVDLYLASAEQSQALLREYALRGMSAPDQTYSGNEVARSGAAHSEVWAAVQHAVPDQAAVAQASELDIPLGMVFSTPADFGVLQAVLDDANRLAHAGELLTLPSLPELVAFRDWICHQVLAQAAGAAPAPWLLSGDRHDTGLPPAQWEDMSRALASEQPRIVGDDANRIIGANSQALDLLGWTEQDLLGQRILAVIPERFRERHLASFTLTTVTGEAPLLGQPLALNALAHDGREIPITLTLSRHAARAGRSVYLARLEARD